LHHRTSWKACKLQRLKQDSQNDAYQVKQRRANERSIVKFTKQIKQTR
jgi:hypothetical protein